MNYLRLHPRLFIAAAVGIVVGLILPERLGQLTRMVAAWDGAATIYLATVWLALPGAPLERIRRRAQIQDESGFIILVISIVAAIISLGAILGLLTAFKDPGDAARLLHLALAVYTIVGSWFFLHTLFTLHYAHEYYGDTPDPDDGPAHRGGLQFAGNSEPVGYVDFAYFSFTIGMTAQTSDTGVTSGTMRRLTLVHAVVSFFFNTVILALSINIAAGLI